jgi:hypothetical protein
LGGDATSRGERLHGDSCNVPRTDACGEYAETAGHEERANEKPLLVEQEAIAAGQKQCPTFTCRGGDGDGDHAAFGAIVLVLAKPIDLHRFDDGLIDCVSLTGGFQRDRWPINLADGGDAMVGADEAGAERRELHTQAGTHDDEVELVLRDMRKGSGDLGSYGGCAIGE